MTWYECMRVCQYMGTCMCACKYALDMNISTKRDDEQLHKFCYN